MEQALGQNVTAVVDGDKLTLTIDMSADLGRSNSGKSHLIATTQGNKAVPGCDGAFVGLNIYRKA